jgi:hypothetical protein
VGKTTKYTDLTGEDPGPHAIVEDLTLQAVEWGGELVGARLIAKANETRGSPLNGLPQQSLMCSPDGSAPSFSS